MKLGVLKDIKQDEYRVVLTPSEISSYVHDGHSVYVEKDAGVYAGFSDADYEQAGAMISDKYFIYGNCDLVAKVKEIEASEYDLLREGQILFTCIHPAAKKEEVDALLAKKVIAFAAEDTHRYGSTNCEAAGKLGAFMGLYAMLTQNGGCGKFVSGLGGAPAISVLVLGNGVVARSSIEVLHNLGAKVTVMARNIGRLREISTKYHGQISTMYSSRYNIEQMLPKVDMVVVAVRWDKSNTEYLISREMLRTMAKGSVLVDISNDYGAIETFHETTHSEPMYIEEGVVHYCVSNIPSNMANTASIAYSAALNTHISNLLNNGVAKACVNDGYLRRGMVTYKGYLTHEETSQIQNRPWIQPEKILNIENLRLDKAPKNTVAHSDNFYAECEFIEK